MRIGIIIDKNKSEAVKSALLAESWLKKRGYKVYHVFGDKILKRLDFVITFGGDGLVLHTANKIKEYGIPMIRVNYGYVGALTNIMPEAMLEKLSQVFEHGNYIITKRTRIEVAVVDNREYKPTIIKDALNDVVIERRGSNSIVVNVKVDAVSNEYRGDAVIFATRTGSTAYSECAGGPTLIDDNKFILRVVSPSNRELLPYLIKPNSVAFQVVRIVGKARLSVDGKSILHLKDGQLIIVRKSEMVTLFVEIGDVEKKRCIKCNQK